MAKVIFKSKSASRMQTMRDVPAIDVTRPPKTVVVERNVKNVVFWSGTGEAAQRAGKALKFNINKVDVLLQDGSLILNSKCLILYNAVLGLRLIKITSFAVNYGIPVVWYHSHITPHKWMWSFRYVMVGKEDINKFWHDICLLI